MIVRLHIYILVIQKSISLNIGGNERELVSSKHA